MKGLELSRRYFEAFGRPMLEARFGEYADRIAVGLVGHGSECFGFDDELSRDHDFEPSFCLWITKEDERIFGFRLERAYASLPHEFEGVTLKQKSRLGGGSRGVHTIEDFYARYTGLCGAPQSAREWLYVPSFYLAEATNGEVFCDPLGKFSEIRNQILNGMPRDVLLKKIASRAVLMAQTGQYNFPRCISHGDSGAAGLALAKFCEHAANMLFLLNRRHAPYYKWLLRAAEDLPTGSETIPLIRELLEQSAPPEEKQQLIEKICAEVADIMVEQGLCSRGSDSYLEGYAFSVNEKICDSEIRNLHIIQD